MQTFHVPELGVVLNEQQMREYRRTGVSPLPSLTAAHEAAKKPESVEAIESPKTEEKPSKRGQTKNNNKN